MAEAMVDRFCIKEYEPLSPTWDRRWVVLLGAKDYTRNVELGKRLSAIVKTKLKPLKELGL